jgi:probable HAF family extracellular repeat protein
MAACHWSFVALAAVLAVGPVHAQLKYRIQDLGTIQGGTNEDIYPRGLNNAGLVVGTSIYDPGSSKIGAFIWEQGRMRALVPITTWDLGYSAAAINDRGVVAGEFFDRHPRGPRRPVLFQDGGWVDIGVVPGETLTARVRDINEAGQVVGHDNGEAFLFDGTRSRRLPLPGNVRISEAVAINDHGLVAVINYSDGDHFLYDSARDVLSSVPRSIDANTHFEPVALNNAGQLLGEGRFEGPDGSTVLQAYIYADGRFQAISGIDTYTIPAAINDQGWVVGSFLADSNTPPVHPFLWRDGVRSDLNDLIAPRSSGAQWELMAATDINERGQIVGYGHVGDSSLFRGFIATPVPEAGTWALMLAGLGLLGWRLRRGAPATA